MTIYKGLNANMHKPSEFKWTAAHEFGHLLGVDDAYTTKNPPVSIYNDRQTRVQCRDVCKVLMAFIKNKRQRW